MDTLGRQKCFKQIIYTRDIPKNLKISLFTVNIHTEIYTNLYIAMLFMIAKMRYNPNVFQQIIRFKKLQCIHTMEYYSAVNRKEFLACNNRNKNITWMKQNRHEKEHMLYELNLYGPASSKTVVIKIRPVVV